MEIIRSFLQRSIKVFTRTAIVRQIQVMKAACQKYVEITILDRGTTNMYRLNRPKFSFDLTQMLGIPLI